MPEVTVLMPVFNGARFLRSAVDSVLAQTVRDFEFLIIDDGSTDATPAILRSYSDRRLNVVTHEANQGVVASLNDGLERARSSLIVRQDADDVSRPERLERQAAFLHDRRDVAIVGSQGYVIDDHDRAIGLLNRSQDDVSLRWYQLWDNPFTHSSVMFRRDIVWKELGGFETIFDRYTEDHALWSRLLQRARGANLPERLFSYRVHGASIIEGITQSAPDDERRAGFHQALARVIARNLTAVFGNERGGDADLMACFVTGVDAKDLRRFLSQFEALLDRFLALYPAAKRSADFQRTIARQYDAMAYRVRPSRRSATVLVYAAALAGHPGLVRWLPWQSVLALTLFGKGGRNRLGRLRRRRCPSTTSLAAHP